jgi:serine/threonine protein kinase
VKFGKYLLLERIGVGGMAEVFRAKTFGAEGFERLVAIKRILPHLVEDEDFVKMFVDEAKIAVRLSHPNIVAIHDLGRAEGTLYIAMEFIPGRDLRAIYDYEHGRGGRTSVGLACHIVMKMCEALHHAHFATGPRGEPLQVIHRDVSPQNVLLSFDGEVKVADFGLAKARGRMVQTQAGVVKGKLAYMSPEQLRGDEIDHRVDVFGLGIVLFELLAGTRLFLGPSDMDTLRRVYEAKVPPMHALNPDVHPDLEAIARKALAKDREQRYATALDMHDDLQSFVYAHGALAGASAVRSYLREVFPDAAPSSDDELPPFASSPPLPEPPRLTHRPPALRREIPPPASVPPANVEESEPAMDASGMVSAMEDASPYEGSGLEGSLGDLAPPPASQPSYQMPQVGFAERVGAGLASASNYTPALELSGIDESQPAPPPPLELSGIDDAPTPSQVREPPTEIPAAPAVAVAVQRVISTGTPSHPPPPFEHSQAVAKEFPSVPPGVYEEWPTEQIPPPVNPRVEPTGHDTSPAPAMTDVPGFVTTEWTDEPTLHMGSGPLEKQRQSEPPADPWADESTTVVVDGKSNTGS